MDFLRVLTDPFQYPFMQLALLEVVLMGLTCGIIGSYVVLRGMAFLGDALSHAIFPGVVIALLLGASFFWGALVFGLITALGIGALAQNRRVSEDTAIGVLFAGMFALGIVLISTGRVHAIDPVALLFGNILGVSPGDLWASVAIGLIVLGVMVVVHKGLV